MNSAVTTLWEEAGFPEQTVIQRAVSDPLLAGQSVVGIAPTGSGKTLAYGIPVLTRLVPNLGPQLLIIVPAQELAIQIRDVLTPLAHRLNLGVLGLIGSANRQRQIDRLKGKPAVIVATLGRLADLIDERKLRLVDIKTVIVDEFDSFETEDITTIRHMRQDGLLAGANLGLFSATRNDDDIAAFRELWPDLQVFDETKTDDTRGPVTHYLLDRQFEGKVQFLERLGREKHQRVFVFFNHKHIMQKVAGSLRFTHVPYSLLATDGRQVQRAEALGDFRRGRTNLLLTTDVAARGLDVADVTAVVNFELPNNITTYIHRTGRTGRMGESGTVYNMGNDHDLRDLRHLLGDSVTLVAEKPLVKKREQDDETNDENTPSTDSHDRARTRPASDKMTARKPTAAKSHNKRKQRWRNKKNVGKHW
ncbi:MAG: DEAD/DEAH box helicase [Schleiferilactobacillus harbinensis]|jgi:superfamily II DNA/RNA helicase|nr:DEAD/DEAH box helicase [Schleiferilactobacillus harbinensis]MCI1911868.1 DEAD/DEAH box helicase [Schleiferilactobacillus harbinensis]